MKPRFVAIWAEMTMIWRQKESGAYLHVYLPSRYLIVGELCRVNKRCSRYKMYLRGEKTRRPLGPNVRYNLICLSWEQESQKQGMVLVVNAVPRCGGDWPRSAGWYLSGTMSLYELLCGSCWVLD